MKPCEWRVNEGRTSGGAAGTERGPALAETRVTSGGAAPRSWRTMSGYDLRVAERRGAADRAIKRTIFEHDQMGVAGTLAMNKYLSDQLRHLSDYDR